MWTDDDHIADVFDETKKPPEQENGTQEPIRASGSAASFNVCHSIETKKLFII